MKQKERRKKVVQAEKLNVHTSRLWVMGECTAQQQVEKGNKKHHQHKGQTVS